MQSFNHQRSLSSMGKSLTFDLAPVWDSLNALDTLCTVLTRFQSLSSFALPNGE